MQDGTTYLGSVLDLASCRSTLETWLDVAAVFSVSAPHISHIQRGIARAVPDRITRRLHARHKVKDRPHKRGWSQPIIDAS